MSKNYVLKAKVDGEVVDMMPQTGADNVIVDASTNETLKERLATLLSQNSAINSALASKANLASPTFTGAPKAPTAAAGTNTTQLATTAFVQSEIASKIAAADAMIYKGTIGTGGTVTALPATHSTGWTYKVITAGTYAGVVCEVGDMIVCLTDGTTANDAHWTVIQSNIDGAVVGPASAVDAHVAVFSGTTGKVIKDSSFTIGKSVPSDAVFTDTHYTAKNVVGASATATANAAATNGNVRLNLIENNVVRSSNLIKGSGATTVISDANGVITINSSNSTYAAMTGATATAAGKSGLVPVPAAGKQNSVLLGNGTWGNAIRSGAAVPSDLAEGEMFVLIL